MINSSKPLKGTNYFELEIYKQFLRFKKVYKIPQKFLYLWQKKLTGTLYSSFMSVQVHDIATLNVHN